MTLIISFLWSWAVILSGGGQMARSCWRLQQLLSKSVRPLARNDCHTCRSVGIYLMTLTNCFIHLLCAWHFVLNVDRWQQEIICDIRSCTVAPTSFLTHEAVDLIEGWMLSNNPRNPQRSQSTHELIEMCHFTANLICGIFWLTTPYSNCWFWMTSQSKNKHLPNILFK